MICLRIITISIGTVERFANVAVTASTSAGEWGKASGQWRQTCTPDVIENMDDDSNNWNEVKPSEDGKRNHSSSPEQNTLRTPVKKMQSSSRPPQNYDNQFRFI
ncbi:uncharacterized protein LOC112686501 [Sipha flava]|uniref:Uncharacterized protein LOC112686501 n=1 Tax=Sipha flava TaxID=143950 RepID=A0A8B8FW39_9HEMI|nr:uncharacterized protein LOC112686501 [Sipha flava]